MHKVTALPPLLYNLAAEILLFRIELDNSIRFIRKPETLPGPITIPSSPFKHESNRETNYCDCFADENILHFTMFDFLFLSSLKNALSEFKTLSGLSTNFEKTCIMRIGNIWRGKLVP